MNGHCLPSISWLLKIVARCPTFAFTGAKPASEAPLVERPVQGMVRRHFTYRLADKIGELRRPYRLSD